MKRLLLLSLLLGLIWGCKKEPVIGEEPQSKVEQKEEQPESTREGKFIFEPDRDNVLSLDGFELRVSRESGDTSEEVEAKVIPQKDIKLRNSNLRAVTKGLNIRGDIAEVLKRGGEISIPMEEGLSEDTKVYIVALLEMKDDSEGTARALSLDQGTRWVKLIAEETGKNMKEGFGDIWDGIRFTAKVERNISVILQYVQSVTFVAIMEKQLPIDSQMGLKEVVFEKGEISLVDPKPIEASDRVLLLVHGWTSGPLSCWSHFVREIKPYIDGLKRLDYTRIMTFGYYSGLAIDRNGQLLGAILQKRFNGAHVDIVAHSMGGLVARSAIENHGTPNLVNTLITLGTPHLGSNRALLKHAIELLLSLTDYGSSLLKDYSEGSAGFGDLLDTSDFIKKLQNNEPAIGTYYYAIASIYDRGIVFSSSLSWMIFRDTDSVVSLESALGVPKIGTRTRRYELTAWMPHTAMVDDPNIIQEVAVVLARRADGRLALEQDSVKLVEGEKTTVRLKSGMAMQASAKRQGVVSMSISADKKAIEIQALAAGETDVEAYVHNRSANFG